MTLLWTLAGIALALGIARYNESNKLFWQLMLAFAVGFTATTICSHTFGNNKEGKTNLTQVCPTQAPMVTSNTTMYSITDVPPTATYTKVTASVPVSQDNTPAKCENGFTQSKVYGKTRDQPQFSLIKPPEHNDSG